MKRPLALLFILFYLVQIAVCQAQLSRKEITIKELRSIPGFDNVILEGSANVHVHQSSTTKIEIRGPKAMVQRTGVIVTNQVLKIYSGYLENQSSQIRIDIFTPVIREITQRGGGEIKVGEGYKAVDQFKCVLYGGGSMDLASIPVNSLNVSIEGGGLISARVNGQIVGKINGGGRILYLGNPDVECEIEGGGAINRK
jgi:hypothetical protein